MSSSECNGEHYRTAASFLTKASSKTKDLNLSRQSSIRNPVRVTLTLKCAFCGGNNSPCHAISMIILYRELALLRRNSYASNV